MTHITLYACISAMEEAITERGSDYCYPGASAVRVNRNNPICHYRWSEQDVENGFTKPEDVGTPACAVGAILARLGVLCHLVQPALVRGTYTDNAVSIDDLVARHPLRISAEPAALRYLNMLQTYQDIGTSWGKSHDIACHVVGVRRLRVQRPRVPEFIPVMEDPKPVPVKELVSV
jgi:hypothetical protein